MTVQAGHMPVRVAIVSPIVARYDAISAAARDTYYALLNQPGFEPVVLTLRNDFADQPASIVSGVADLLLHPAFIAADLIIYHFGIYSDLFDALIAAKGRARQIVRFHNITPARFAPQNQVTLIEKSYRQIHSFNYSDEVWADSEVNGAVLRGYGIDGSRIQVIPLVVGRPPLARLRDKATMPLEILFVGRFVPSKGVLDLIEAIAFVRRRSSVPFRLHLVGNLEWSDADYLRKIEQTIAAPGLGLKEVVEFHGTVDYATQERLFHAVHILAIPSYHEGFCKPVIEALRSGAVPVGYAAYNLPTVVNGFGRLVSPGDKEALAAVLTEMMEGISRALATPLAAELPLDRGLMSLSDFETATRDYVSQFSFDRLAPMMRERARKVLNLDGESKPGTSTIYPHRNFPSLDRHHIDNTARVFATRNDLIEALNIAPGEAIAEVGVALGDFSEFLLEFLQPSCFVAIDTFELHKLPELWGQSTAEQFAQHSHLHYYRKRLARHGDRMIVDVGPSHQMLAKYPDETFALIYIDAGHDYENVSRDAALAARKVKKGGVIIFNDYTMFDHITSAPYGVVPAVNELITGGQWRVVGFALQQHMFCDIAICR